MRHKAEGGMCDVKRQWVVGMTKLVLIKSERTLNDEHNLNILECYRTLEFIGIVEYRWISFAWVNKIYLSRH